MPADHTGPFRHLFTIAAAGMILFGFPAGGAASDRRDAPRRLLHGITKWGCQFQNLDIAAVAGSALDMVVIDNMLDGGPVKPDVVRSLQRKPDGSRRLVFAYLSVGEAETYRLYWRAEWANAPPRWIGHPNPNWPESFNIRYWDPAWQKIVFSGAGSKLDAILDAGFDGVFLDRVDAYLDWQQERPSGQEDMISLVENLMRRARAERPEFLAVGQNSEPLLLSPRYRSVIDAVSKESLLFGLAGPEVANVSSDISWSLRYLKVAQENGLKILPIEYLDDPAKIQVARQRFDDLGFTPFFGNRALDRLPRTP